VAIAAAGCASKRDGETGTDAGSAAACTVGAKQCMGNTFEVCETTGWTVISQCPLFCASDEGCISCDPADPTCAPVSSDCQQAQMDRSYVGCEYWAVDLDNATDVLAPAQTQLPGMECSLWPGTKLLQRPLRVCYDGSSWTAGECDRPNEACPSGFTCV